MDSIINKALALTPLTVKEALMLYQNLPTSELLLLGDTLRHTHKPGNIVTWQIDRNVNITNVCVSGCKFCNFHCKPHQTELGYITSIESYKEKIEQTIALGGDQLLLQGGMHPKLSIDYYIWLLSELKHMFPQIKLHALGAPEVVHISKISGLSFTQTLERLVEAGLDSLPGAGAEILDNKIRRSISPGKCTADEWLEVMQIAHKMNIPTSATMMYGHIEAPHHIVEHHGFVAFIPWVFCSEGTELAKKVKITEQTPEKYLRIIAISRIVLNNIKNIQASWLTLGAQTATMALHSGANDLGSIMIEENVVSSAGATFKMGADQMRSTIIDAGFTPQLRDQLYRERTI
ncbi:MAG: CofH family radical SAM protein [Rikenellaceae bacterium]